MTQLVFLPGLAADHMMWRAQLAAMPTHLNAVVSTVHTQHPTLEQMAAALLHTYPDDLILVGASMGGMLAMEVVRQAPPRVRGLALLGTVARPEMPVMRDLREAAIRLFEQGRVEEVLRFNLPQAFHASRADDLGLQQTYLDFVMAAGPAQLIAQNRAVIARPDARPHLGRITCPTLVLCGDSDRLTPPECSEEMAALIPGAELHLIPQCGHMLSMERPIEVNALLLVWLEKFQP